MSALDLAEALDRPIAYHRCFVRLAGSVAGAVFLSQVVYWQKRCPEGRDGWWWKTRDEWEEETGLTRSEQESARKLLTSAGILEEAKRGIPCRLFYRLDGRILAVLLAESCQQAGGKPADYSETTSETSSETTGEESSGELSPRTRAMAQKEEARKEAEVWYGAYPRKVKRPAAIRLYVHMRLKNEIPPLPLLLAGLERQKADPYWSDPKYIPHPTSYLNNARWEDKEALPPPPFVPRQDPPRLPPHPSRYQYADFGANGMKGSPEGDEWYTWEEWHYPEKRHPQSPHKDIFPGEWPGPEETNAMSRPATMGKPLPGEFFDSAGVLFRVPQGALEQDFGGTVGRCLQARRCRVDQDYTGIDLHPEGEREWVEIARIATVWVGEAEVRKHLWPEEEDF